MNVGRRGLRCAFVAHASMVPWALYEEEKTPHRTQHCWRFSNLKSGDLPALWAEKISAHVIASPGPAWLGVVRLPAGALFLAPTVIRRDRLLSLPVGSK